jgi:hypothetical protein
VRLICASKKLLDPEADQLAGTLLNKSSFDVLVSSDANVYRPDGSLLLAYRADVLGQQECTAAQSALRKATETLSINRGIASGKKDKAADRRIKRDGTVTNTVEAKPVHSGIVGYFDRYQRIPYCRLTAFNLDHPERFTAALPFIRSVDDVFREVAPERYAAQIEMVTRTHPDFVIHGTAFTTITVNRNWQTAVHQDAGDYRPGFGVMSALRSGTFDGCYLVFPAYRVAVDMQTRGVCLADVHEWHGNTPLVGRPGEYERLSCVFYYRANMHRCGSAAEELETAKHRRKGQPLWSD